MASSEFTTAKAAITNRTSGYVGTVMDELARNPPAISLGEREALKAGLAAAVSNFSGGSYESLTGTRVLTLDDGGKTFGLNLAGGFTTTLPLISTLPPNWSVEFFVETVNSGDYIIAANATDADKMAGHVLSSSGGAEDTEGTATGDQINLLAAAGVTKVGDWVKVRTNGISWFARIETATAAAATITG